MAEPIVVGKQRRPWLVVVWNVITLHMYDLLWHSAVIREFHAVGKSSLGAQSRLARMSPTGEALVYFFLWPLSLVRTPRNIREVQRIAGVAEHEQLTPLRYVLVSIATLGFGGVGLAQMHLNRAWRELEQRAARDEAPLERVRPSRTSAVLLSILVLLIGGGFVLAVVFPEEDPSVSGAPAATDQAPNAAEADAQFDGYLTAADELMLSVQDISTAQPAQAASQTEWETHLEDVYDAATAAAETAEGYPDEYPAIADEIRVPNASLTAMYEGMAAAALAPDDAAAARLDKQAARAFDRWDADVTRLAATHGITFDE